MTLAQFVQPCIFAMLCPIMPHFLQASSSNRVPYRNAIFGQFVSTIRSHKNVVDTAEECGPWLMQSRPHCVSWYGSAAAEAQIQW